MNDCKILLIIPHQDDEIHIAGSLIASMKNTNNVYVLYTTNGDFIFNAKYRYKEALKSLKTLGNIKKEHVFFLGYSDQAYDQKSHMYNDDEDWISPKGIKETYAPEGFEEWNYYKYKKHCKFNKKNFTRNIKEVIEYLKPDIIICNDLDFHPDHIMTSLCCEKAIGEILNKENNEYYPIVLKTFSYENSYFGKKNFLNQQNYEMNFNYDKNGNIESNPYYNCNNKIDISINKKCYTKNLFENIIYKASKAHKSQVLVGHIDSMINANIVYWERNTENLLNKANIMVSSGNANYLKDFILADTKNVLNGNKTKIQYDEGIWIPSKDDTKREIDITLNKEQYVSLIKIYNGRKNKKTIQNIEIQYNNKKITIKLLEQYVNNIHINEKIKKIKIKILDSNIENGFSEIEILEREKERKKERKRYY